MLMKHPGFAAAAILALALGIGVNTTIFGFVDGLLFRPLQVDRLDEVVRVGAVDPERDPNDVYNNSYPIYTDYKAGSTAFDGLAGVRGLERDEPEPRRRAARAADRRGRLRRVLRRPAHPRLARQADRPRR
jgi:hypothetical protein